MYPTVQASRSEHDPAVPLLGTSRVLLCTGDITNGGSVPGEPGTACTQKALLPEPSGQPPGPQHSRRKRPGRGHPAAPRSGRWRVLLSRRGTPLPHSGSCAKARRGGCQADLTKDLGTISRRRCIQKEKKQPLQGALCPLPTPHSSALQHAPRDGPGCGICI